MTSIQQKWDEFIKTKLPSYKEERWKYADLSFLKQNTYTLAKKIESDDLMDVIHQHRLQNCESILIVIVNGYYMPHLSDLTKLPENVIVQNFSRDIPLPQSMNKINYAFANFNAENFTDGLVLRVPDKCKLIMPIHLLSLTLGDDQPIIQPRNYIALGQDSELTIAEEHFSYSEQTYVVNMVTTISIEKNAILNHYKIQREGEQAAHIASTFVYQKQNSNTSFMNISMGSVFARDDLVIHLQEAGANCYTSGFYRLRINNQYIDNHVDINHEAAHSTSDMLYKGIVDANAKAVFNGRLHVEKDAQKIIAYQANHHLLLSKGAEAYSKPELEIYADDVKCKHGATTGQLDQDALFYLRSRGIEKTEAMRLLLQGFAEEILNRIMHPGIKACIQEIL